MDHEGDDVSRAPSGGDGAAAQGTEPSVATVPTSAEESSATSGQGPIVTVVGGGDGRMMITPMDSSKSHEGFDRWWYNGEWG